MMPNAAGATASGGHDVHWCCHCCLQSAIMSCAAGASASRAHVAHWLGVLPLPHAVPSCSIAAASNWSLRLVGFISDMEAKVNLIVFNPHEGTRFRPSDIDTVLTFRSVLIKVCVRFLVGIAMGFCG